MIKWQQGRQGGGYKKLNLFSSLWLGFDVYLIKAREGVKIPAHYDKINGYKHFRINILLYGDYCSVIENYTDHWTSTYCSAITYICKFRPDIQKHAARFYKDTLILSIGRFKKNVHSN